MTNDSAPICSECNATDKPMSNANGRSWLCDDCRLPNLESYKFNVSDIKKHLDKK